MAIALGGRPDESAKMVWSRGCIRLFVPELPERQRDSDLRLCPDSDHIAPQYGAVLLQQNRSIGHQKPVANGGADEPASLKRHVYSNTYIVNQQRQRDCSLGKSCCTAA
jgi:hypothetical protein